MSRSRAYRVKCITRWFGCPCEDITDDIGVAWLCEFSLERLREAAMLFGFTAKNSNEDELDEIGIACIEIEIPNRYKDTNAESAWLDFCEV